MSYRPFTDIFILARAKLKPGPNGEKQSYHGSFPAGALHRFRQLLGVRRVDPVLHVCAGLVRENLYRGFEANDRTLDLAVETKPDYLMDARRLGVKKGDLFPLKQGGVQEVGINSFGADSVLWPAILIDRPYTTADHAEYDVPTEAFPNNLNDLLKRALTCVEPGGRVGVLDYLWPSPPVKLGREIAVIAVGTGRNNRARWFTVFERLVQNAPQPELQPGEIDARHGMPPVEVIGRDAGGTVYGRRVQTLEDGALTTLVQPAPSQMAVTQEMAARPTPEALKGKTLSVKRKGADNCVGCQAELAGVQQALQHTCLPWADMAEAAPDVATEEALDF